MDLDWVKRKAIGEQFVEEQRHVIWRDLRTSLESATKSYNVHYGGSAEIYEADDYHLRISVKSRPPYHDAIIDVTFAPPEVRVVCTMGACKTWTYVLNANRDAPFRSNKEQLTSDQVSEAILRCIFFPAESRGVQTSIVSPCRQ